MSYTDKKITQAEINAHHVQGATDYLIGNPQQNKAVFDDLPEFIAGKFNDLIDEIAGQHGDEIREAVDEWLAEHPEVTTTVQDNSLTTPKYVDGSVTAPKIAEGAVTPSKLDRAYATPAELASVNANLTNEMDVLDARMDTFASLPEGSTSGNAELLDIRVGDNGVTYSSAGDAVRGQVGGLQNAVANIGKSITAVLSATLSAYVNYTTGSIGSANNHYSATNRLQIPAGCTKIIFPNIGVASSGVGGWAVYRSNTGTETGDYIRGGQTTYIDVQSGDNFYAVTNWSAGVADTNIDVVYVYGTIGESIEDINYKADGNYTQTIDLRNGSYWNSTTGVSGANVNYSATANRVKIPKYCKRIVFPSVKYAFQGTGGWAVYRANTGTEAGDFIRGGQTSYIDVQENEKYFVLTTQDKTATTIDVIFVIGSMGEAVFDSARPLSKKMICFVGDSVTFGYDDSTRGQLVNPYPKQVSEMLDAFVSNEGVSSASLMQGNMSGGSPTPRAWCVDYANLYDGYDIIGTMIGINDAYRNYTLGEFTDRTTDTFYGALHTYWLGMLNKYAPENGKRLFCMLYPQYESSYAAARYINFRQALIEVANYYSIPILDLSHEMGVSCYADSEYKYWANTTEGHSPHLTQLGADVVAPVVASFINSHFSY